ncbi:MAG: VIT domain-containing protein [Armatimonadota bacterium]
MSASPGSTASTAPRPIDISYQDYRRNRRRRDWVICALILSLLAIFLEGVTHICASSFFDPMPDLATSLAYGLVVATLWFNERVLADDPPRFIQRLGQKRATAVAIAATVVSLIVAAMAAFMFIPLLPFALFLLMMVIGVLLLVPLLDTILLIIQLRTLLALWRTDQTAVPDGAVPTAVSRTNSRRLVVGTSIISAAAVFWLVARPTLIGQYTAQGLRAPDASFEQKRAFRVLRFLKGEGTLLDLAYKRNPPYWVCLGYNAVDRGFWPWNGYNWDGDGFPTSFSKDSDKARRTYFLLTGTPFESEPRPTSLIRQGGLFGGPDDVAVEETGGYVVGRPVPDLSLAQSEMHATADPRSETAKYEWTMTFRNDSSQPQEARADVLLPHGGVGHAVSLWINGVEQQARFGSPQKVRAAYQEIAVVQRRDPLLVTMPAPDHLLVQCFPVPAKGEMKIKIGITAPLRWQTSNSGESGLIFDLPAFGPVNFGVQRNSVYHALLHTNGSGSLGSLTLKGDDLFNPPHLGVGSNSERRSPSIGDRLAPGVVRDTDLLSYPTQPVDLTIVLDASAGVEHLRDSIDKELISVKRSLPKGSRLRFCDTANYHRVTLWRDTDSAQLYLYGRLASSRFKGGTDPAAALAYALKVARRESKNPSAIIFLHAASPINVSDLAEVRKELRSRPDNGPALVGVQLAPRAQDAVMMDLAGFDRVYARRALPGDSGAIAEAVRFACQSAVSGAVTSTANAKQPLGGHTPAVGGVLIEPAVAVTSANRGTAWARLAQATQTMAGWYESNTLADPKALDLRIEAGRPAAKARLVTPLSSAVVLETKEQYKKAGLDEEENASEGDKDAKPKTDNISASPEPGSLLLFGIGLAAAARVWCRRRRL